MLAEANNQSSGYFWMGLNFMIFMVIFITISGVAGWETGLLAGGFAGLLISIFLTYLGLQAYWVLGTYLGMLTIIFFYIMWSYRYD